MSKTFNVSLYWRDGGYGLVTYETQSSTLLFKPSFILLPDFTELLYVQDEQGDRVHNFYIDSNGLDHELGEDQRDELYQWIERNFKTSSGGGGGGTGTEITHLYREGTSPNIYMKRADGTSALLEMESAIRNTSSYSLSVMVGGKSWHEPFMRMFKGDGDTSGAKVTALREKTSLEPKFFGGGGSARGGTYDMNTGQFHISTDGVSAAFKAFITLGIHPDFPDHHKGWPDGKWIARMDVEYLNEDGTPEVLGTTTTTGWTVDVGDYPNDYSRSQMIDFSISGIACKKAGWYRLMFSMESFTSHPTAIKYVRFMAVPNGELDDWDNNIPTLSVTGKKLSSDPTVPIEPI